MPELSPEQAHALAELHQAICDALFVMKITDVEQLSDDLRELIPQVQVHVATCREGHAPIDGLFNRR